MTRGILDTSVVIDLDRIDDGELPQDQAITTVTLGELTLGPLVANTPAEQADRQRTLQTAERFFAQSILPYDEAAARIYGIVAADALRRGRSSRARVADHQIAAIAISAQLPVYTANLADFEGIDGLEVRAVTPRTQRGEREG